MSARRLLCSEAEYLRTYGIKPETAAEFDRRFTPRNVVDLVQAGVSASEANAAGAKGWDCGAIIDTYAGAS